MAEENQFQTEDNPATERAAGVGGPVTEPAPQPLKLVPISPAEHARRPRQLKLLIGLLALTALALAGWIYKRNVDPIHALEAFDAGERLLKTGRYSQAIVSFDLAISLQPDYAEAYTMRGRANISLARPVVALPDFSKVIELRPTDPQAYLDRGSAHFSLGELPEATVDFNQAIEIDPKHATAYNLRGSTIRAMGDLPKALLDFERAVELLPNMDNIYQRGATYQQLGQHESAIADFSRVISFEPSSSQAYFARAQSYRAIGDTTSAARDHRTARVLDGL